MTGAEGLFGTPEKMGRKIKEDVFRATFGLTISVGASTIKYVAKVASDFQKPDGLTVVKSEDFIKFMKNRGYGIYYQNSADFAKTLTQADKDNGEIMKAAGIAK